MGDTSVGDRFLLGVVERNYGAYVAELQNENLTLKKELHSVKEDLRARKIAFDELMRTFTLFQNELKKIIRK